MQLTKEVIKEINNMCPENQGVFTEPYGIPVKIKEPVIYSRYSTGGVSGGSYHDDSNPTHYSEEEPKDRFKVLDIVLERLAPRITYLQYKKIDALVHNNEETENEYYGNCTEWKIEYVILSDLYKLLDKIDNENCGS